VASCALLSLGFVHLRHGEVTYWARNVSVVPGVHKPVAFSGMLACVRSAAAAPWRLLHARRVAKAAGGKPAAVSFWRAGSCQVCSESVNSLRPACHARICIEGGPGRL
jgi:hypothetical protein